MRPALLSLALLGTTARGCFFRGDAPRDSPPSRYERIRLGNLRGGPIPEEPQPTHQPEEVSVRERRVIGKRALKDACSDNVEFEACHRDKGSALQLEECLRKRSRTISGTCLEGIETWKTLLAETSPGARRRPAAGGKEPQGRGRSARFHDVGQEAQEDGLWPLGEAWIVDEDEPFTRTHGFSLLGGRPDHGPFAGGGPGHPPPNHHRDGPGGAPWEHHPLPRHFGKEPRFGPLSGRRPHHEAGPGPRPSMFSVLADWLFATSDDSSSSDSSSDSSSSDSSSDSSAAGFVDGFDAGFGAGLDAGLDDIVGFGVGIDAGSFPAGHPRRPGGPAPDVKFGWLEDDDSMMFETETPPLVRLDLEVPGLFKGDSDDDFLRDLPPPRPLSSQKRRPFSRGPSKGDDMPMEMDVLNRWEEDMMREDKPVRGQPRPQHARHPGGLPGPHHRGGGGGGGDGGSRDHIRYRNRHPEDHNPWFADSFDSVEDLDLMEGVLALFFFIGSVTLMLLPFFLLARALKRLVRLAHGGRGGADAPDGYQALPEDDAAAAAAVSVSGQQRGGNGRGGAVDDDDAIVVTGTPVNPPPSVHV